MRVEPDQGAGFSYREPELRSANRRRVCSVGHCSGMSSERAEPNVRAIPTRSTGAGRLWPGRRQGSALRYKLPNVARVWALREALEECPCTLRRRSHLTAAIE